MLFLKRDASIFALSNVCVMNRSCVWSVIILLFFGKLVLGQDLSSKLQKLPGFVNGPNTDEIAPILTWDGNTMYFTRMKDARFNRTLYYNGEDLSKILGFADYLEKIQEVYLSLGDKKHSELYLSPFNQDIFIAKKVDGKFAKLHHPDHPLNNALPNSVCAIMPDQTTLVLLNQFYENGSMYKGFSFAEKASENEYDFPQPLFIYGFDDMLVGQANICLSRNGEIMIIALAKEGQNDTDLYLSTRVNTNIYSQPELLPGLVNSPYREFSPALSEDGKFLFFSSTRSPGMHQSDIYVSRRLDKSYLHWSEPQRLNEPINSPSHEGHPFVVGKKLYFSSDRDGSWDIFSYDFKAEIQDEIVKEEKALSNNSTEIDESVVSQKDDLVLANRSVNVESKPVAQPKEQVQAKPRINKIKLKVVDSQTQQPLASIVQMRPQEGGLNLNVDVGADGVILDINDASLVTFQAQLDQYISKPITQNLATLLQNAKTIPEIIVRVDPVKVDSRITLDPIYFNRGKDRILSVSYPEIQRLVDVMKKYKNISILIEGHTDNFGDEEALRELSEKRAYAVKRFLESQGVSSDRMRTIGYGRARPISDNSNEFNKAKNRRVEIVITKT
ncbi:OmpA family protein [Membranihabitans marinus]|uniref:OmpA family protein n=1 Tax=Membranihabitans marinus TaxID=1227546 RepID=UPI001F1625D3|nr:OmpA family protein [Membranihabitans marinus]